MKGYRVIGIALTSLKIDVGPVCGGGISSRRILISEDTESKQFFSGQ